MGAPSFPKEALEASIKEICLKDYGIENVEVKIVGKTLGVHLPLKRLFEQDIESLILSGKIKDAENFLQLSEEAVEKIQDVIFTTSRVIISSDEQIDFYVVKATDVEETGMEFILINYVDDVKRVRFWDIALSEYYKRSYRDLKMNPSLYLKKPVLELFRSVGDMKLTEILNRYFVSQATLKDISPFFYTILMEYEFKKDVDIQIVNSRARTFAQGEILVYAEVKEHFEVKPAYKDRKFIYTSGTLLEYLFILKPSAGGYKIFRVLPFNYIGPDGKIEKIEFPENLKLYQNIDTWPSDFEIEEIFIEKFLAEQLTRRAQFVISQDPRALEAFEEIKVTFSFYPEPVPIKGETEAGVTQPEDRFFIATLETKRREKFGQGVPMGVHDDEAIQQIGDLVLREFVSVMRGYYFDQYDHLNLQISETDKLYVLDKEQLERFRKKKLSVEDLLIASPVI